MAPTLGKRKRVTRAELERPSRSASPSSSASDDDSGAEDLKPYSGAPLRQNSRLSPSKPRNPKPKSRPHKNRMKGQKMKNQIGQA
ncbi:hypothetical protein P3342_002647 [Pyrenophora teres f. teres]|nr:hypothetical protein P3342_002647 [Pyrenophora teres f. teres]